MNVDATYEVIKAGAPAGPPEHALYRIALRYPDGSGSDIVLDWGGLVRLHALIGARIEPNPG